MKNNNNTFNDEALNAEIEKNIREAMEQFNNSEEFKQLRAQVNREIGKQVLKKAAIGTAILGIVGAASYAAYKFFGRGE